MLELSKKLASISVNFNELKEDYQTNHSKLMSEDFWRKSLKINKAE